MTNNNNLTTGGGTYKAVNDFLAGVVAAKYEIKAIQKQYKFKDGKFIEDGHKVITRIWAPGEILQNIGFLTSKNKVDDRLKPVDGMYNIYIRPLDPRFILLDDLDRTVLQKLAEIKPCLLMETSPGNYQAWLKLQEVPTETSEQDQIWRTLAAKFQADPFSAKHDQIGRLPGYFNRKPIYFPDYPMVILQKSCDRFSNWEQTIISGTIPPPVVKKNNTSQNQPKKDRSAYDWAVARSLIERGKTDNEIFNYLKEKSTKGAQRGDKYIENTIKRARGKTI